MSNELVTIAQFRVRVNDSKLTAGKTVAAYRDN